MIAIVKVILKGNPDRKTATVVVMNASTLAGACNQASQLLVDQGLAIPDGIVDATAFGPRYATSTAAVVGIES